MKNLLKALTILLLFVSATVFSQAQNLDSLISKISNKQAYIVMLKTMSPRINSEAGTAIIAIGKKATPKLIRILDSKQRGIIAHFILCEIWKATWKEESCCNVGTDGNAEIITVNGLPVYIINNELSAKPADLRKTQVGWKKLASA